MTPIGDIAILKACAEALGYSVVPGGKRYKNGMQIATKEGVPVTNFDPLAHDAEAMHLLAMLNEHGTITISPLDFMFDPAVGTVFFYHYQPETPRAVNLRRAICECAAKRSH